MHKLRLSLLQYRKKKSNCLTGIVCSIPHTAIIADLFSKVYKEIPADAFVIKLYFPAGLLFYQLAQGNVFLSLNKQAFPPPPSHTHKQDFSWAWLKPSSVCIILPTFKVCHSVTKAAPTGADFDQYTQIDSNTQPNKWNHVFTVMNSQAFNNETQTGITAERVSIVKAQQVIHYCHAFR